MIQGLARRVLAWGVASAALGFWAPLARAQSTPNVIPASNGSGMDTHLFRPAIDTKGLFTVNGTDVLGHKEYSFGLVIDYAHVLLRAPGGGQLIDHSFQGTLQGNFGLFNRVVVGVDLPIDLMSGPARSDAVLANHWGPQKLDYQGFSSIAAHGKWSILPVQRGFGLAVGLQLGGGFSGPASNAAADPGFFYWPMVVIEKRFGRSGQFRIAVDAGYRGHTGSGTNVQLRDGFFDDNGVVTYGGGASWRLLDAFDLVAETYGTYLLGDADGALKLSTEAVGGLKIFVEKNSYLMIGGGARYTNGFEGAD
jgi:OOP family OmpA-OmpF porin